MILIVFGTTAELIKLRPVIDRLHQSGANPVFLCTGQQYEELTRDPFCLELQQSGRFQWVAKGFRNRSLTRTGHALSWLVVCFKWLILNYRSLRHRALNTKPLVVVHGDTMTTVVGSVFGSVLRFDVAHVEAGLRSHNWRNPFPEEIDRIITARLADIHFAPDEIAVKNLVGRRGDIVLTHGNTSYDQVRQAVSQVSNHNGIDQQNVLVVLHRTELLSNSALLSATIDQLCVIAIERPVVIVLDALASTSFKKAHNFDRLASMPQVDILGKLAHEDFVSLLLRAQVVLTDSGGLQEECAALGIPCVIHRVVSERFDGLSPGGTAVLTGLNPQRMAQMVLSPPSRAQFSESGLSPSDTILEYLIAKGYLFRRPWP